MASEIECPICGLKGVAAGRESCPQCDSDLTCFRILDSIPAESSNTGARKWPAAGIIVCIVLLAVVAGTSLYLFQTLENRLKHQESEFKQAVSNLDMQWREWNRRIQREIDTISTNPEPEPETRADVSPAVQNPSGVNVSQEPAIKPALQSEKDSEFITYTADDEDTLWEIAERFFGAGYYYPVLLEHNPAISIYDIKDGVQIKILDDRSEAKAVYQEIVIQDGNSSFWEYSVAPGDTAKSIADRFYKDKEMADRIFDFNPGVELAAGQKIKILLQ